MSSALTISIFLKWNRPQSHVFGLPTQKAVVSIKPAKLRASSAGGPVIKISQTFTKLRQQGKVAFIPYIMAGDPDLSTTIKALELLDSCGSDVIELGLPYSKPILDGPIIQAASSRALIGGATVKSIFSMLNKVIPKLSCPVVLCSYQNQILTYGIESFMTSLYDAGVRGLVVPDAYLEDINILREKASKNRIEIVLLTTPITPTERMKHIVEVAEGFVYLVSSVGVTGPRTLVNPRVKLLLQDIKEVTNKPVCVGFGISKPEHVKKIVQWGADGVIVGSTLVKLLGEAKSPEEGLKNLEAFMKTLQSILP